MTLLTQKEFENFFTYFNLEKHQQEGVKILYEALPEHLKQQDSDWVNTYRTPSETASMIPQAAVDLIKEFEGFRSAVYNDGVGVATIGYGATFYENGNKVAWGDPPITQARGEELLRYHLGYFWGIQESTIPRWGDMTDGQRGCLLSFSFNCGAHFYGASGFNTITRCLKEDWNGVPDALMLYVNPGTAVEAGLRRRRAAEIELWKS